jgi:hypothetical protein
MFSIENFRAPTQSCNTQRRMALAAKSNYVDVKCYCNAYNTQFNVTSFGTCFERDKHPNQQTANTRRNCLAANWNAHRKLSVCCIKQCVMYPRSKPYALGPVCKDNLDAYSAPTGVGKAYVRSCLRTLTKLSTGLFCKQRHQTQSPEGRANFVSEPRAQSGLKANGEAAGLDCILQAELQHLAETLPAKTISIVQGHTENLHLWRLATFGTLRMPGWV